MKISTERFKEAVNNSIKGASNNNLLPLTSMVGIKNNGKALKLVTTDGTNTLVVTIENVASENSIDITVPADVFGKLVSKITSSEVELKVENDTLIVKANGTYKIPLVVDEEGSVSFPVPSYNGENVENTKLSYLMSVYNTNKSALATTFENPFLTGYYADDMVVTSDANVITFNEIDLGIGKVLLNAQMISLITLAKTEDVFVVIDDNTVVLGTPELEVIGKALDGIEDYPIDAMKEYLGESFPSSCKVAKQSLLSALGRLALFIEPYDKNGAYFSFGRRGLTLSSKKSSSTESISYVESKDFQQFICCVDIPQMKTQLEAYPEDLVEIHYGLENALKLTSGKITQVISLLEDEDLENKSE